MYYTFAGKIKFPSHLYKIKKTESDSSSFDICLRKLVIKNNPDVSDFINKTVDTQTFNPYNVSIFITNNLTDIDNLQDNKSEFIVNLSNVNNTKRINPFLRAINKKLIMGGVYAGSFENLRERSRRLRKKYKYIPNIIVLTGDFFIFRVFTKLPILRKLYPLITRERNRVISFTEMLGRLSYCGFEMLNMTEINNTLHFVVKKTNLPSQNPEPNYGMVFKMSRIGKNGKRIYVYKLRTMHIYSEYLQKFVYENFSLKEGGKFNDDFRVTEYGRILRKLWIDELPMFVNFFKGELKFIGVRPLSEHYLSLYDQETRDKRLKVKPGLFPPFYADMPKTIDEIQQSENKYIDSYLAHPIKTDLIYFYKIVKNIVFKKARSN